MGLNGFVGSIEKWWSSGIISGDCGFGGNWCCGCSRCDFGFCILWGLVNLLKISGGFGKFVLWLELFCFDFYG